MQALGIIQQVLGLAQAVGGCIPVWQGAMGVVAVTSIAETLLKVFGQGAGDDPVAQALKQTQTALENDLNEVAQRISTDVMNDFGEEHQAAIETAQQWLTGEYTQFDTNVGIKAASLDKNSYTTMLLPSIQQQLGSASPLRNACNFVSDTESKNENLGQGHAFLSMYMCAATLYLNYCTFYSTLQWRFDCEDYLNSNPPDPLHDPKRPTFQTSLVKYETVTELGALLDQVMAYLTQAMTGINNAYMQRQSQMTSQGTRISIAPSNGGWTSQNPDDNTSPFFFDSNNAQRYQTLKNAQYRYTCYRTQTDSLHLDLMTTADIQSLNQTMLVLYKAQCDYHTLVGDPQPAPLSVPTPVYPAQGLVGAPNLSTNSNTSYVVQPGDTLNDIAQKYYGDSIGAMTIYEANKSIIGSDPNVVASYLVLTIPPLTQADIKAMEDARAEYERDKALEWSRTHGGGTPFIDDGGGGIGAKK